MYENVFLAITILLLLMTMGIAVLYYKRIKRVREVYAEAKDDVNYIVLSFNKQLNRQEDRLGALAYRTEIALSKSEDAMSKAKAHDKQLSGLPVNVENVAKIGQTTSAQIENLRKKVDDVVAKQKEFMRKTTEIIPAPEVKIKTAIPIKRERALAPLTETELGVLEILAAEGKKTAPEIRERIALTREHTARLMKKLYEKGYLERKADKMPYSYSLKEEMRRILKKTEAKA